MFIFDFCTHLAKKQNKNIYKAVDAPEIQIKTATIILLVKVSGIIKLMII